MDGVSAEDHVIALDDGRVAFEELKALLSSTSGLDVAS